MSVNNFWEDEDQVSEYDLIEEAQEAEALAEAHAYEPTIIEASEEELETISEQSAYDLDHEESNVIYNARIRLEQAKLYELLINHAIFEGVSADPHAIEIVSNEIKHYIVKRLEILMGLRQPVVQQAEMSSEFNTVELDFLKQLAYKGTLGKSAQTEPDTSPTDGGLKPLSAKTKPAGLKKMTQSQPEIVEQPTPTRRRKNTKTTTTTLPKTGKTGTKKKRTSTQNKRKTNLKSGMGARDLNQNEIEDLAKEDLEMMKNRKDFNKMSAKEKREEIDRVNQRHPPKPVPNTQRIPMVSSGQMGAQYLAQQNSRSDLIGGAQMGGQGGFNAIMAGIANKISMEKSGQGTDE